jgi:hypothetical protein
MEKLKNKSDLVTADGCLPDLVQFGRVPIVQPVDTIVRSVQQADDVQQRGLAGTRWTHDGKVFAVANREIDIPQGVHGLGADLEFTADTPELDQGISFMASAGVLSAMPIRSALTTACSPGCRPEMISVYSQFESPV